jgi:hypothetical protein
VLGVEAVGGTDAPMGIQAQARDDRGDRTHGRQELEGGICAVADDDEWPVRQPAVDEANQLPCPAGDRFVRAATRRVVALRACRSAQKERAR